MPKLTHISFALILLLAISGLAQETPPTDRVFMDSVRVDVVNVEVFVTDKDGNPVYGLKREDFELIVKGEQVEISNFYAPPSPGVQPVETGPIALEAVEIPPPPRHIVVFVDHTNLMPTRRQEVLDSLHGLIEERIAQGDLIMIAAYDARVDVLSNFGDEPEVHLAALETIKNTTASTFQTQSDYNRILRCIEVQCNDAEFIRQDIDTYARELRHRSRIMLAHLGTVVDSMAGLPGRRSLLLVGDGIAVLPGQSLYAVYQNQYVGQDGTMRSQFEARRFSLNRDIDEVTNLANARRVTIYALNGGGVVGNPLSMSSASVSSTQLITTEIDFVRDTNYSASMQDFADSTGGRIIYRPTEETLDDLRQDFDTAYSLGFNPEHEPDDKPRNIKVRVTTDGLKLRFRDNYTLKTDENSAALRTRMAMIAGQSENLLGIEVEFEPVAGRDGRRWVVQTAVRIPIDSLTMVPVGGDLYQGQLEFSFYLEDEKGASTPIQKSELPLELPGEAVSATTPVHITYDVGFMVRPGDHRLALNVTDALSSTASTLTWHLSIDGGGNVVVTDR
ncbi:MAG: VWA domain-containing protein [Acidobacteria bacterium]|nr:VWA domain-containing protein [Candidatus Sulfomarinibacter kjeldsenii]